MIVIDPLQTTALAKTSLTTQTTVDGHALDPSRLPKLCIVLFTHLDRLIAHNREKLVLLLPLQITTLSSPEKGLGAIGRTIMIDVRTRRTLILLILRLLGVTWKEPFETFRRLPQPTLPQTHRGNGSLSLLPGQGSLMIHLEGTLMVHHHRLGTGTPLCSPLTQGGGGLLRRKMRIGRLGLLRLVGKASHLLWKREGEAEPKF